MMNASRVSAVDGVVRGSKRQRITSEMALRVLGMKARDEVMRLNREKDELENNIARLRESSVAEAATLRGLRSEQEAAQGQVRRLNAEQVELQNRIARLTSDMETLLSNGASVLKMSCVMVSNSIRTTLNREMQKSAMEVVQDALVNSEAFWKDTRPNMLIPSRGDIDSSAQVERLAQYIRDNILYNSVKEEFLVRPLEKVNQAFAYLDTMKSILNAVTPATLPMRDVEGCIETVQGLIRDASNVREKWERKPVEIATQLLRDYVKRIFDQIIQSDSLGGLDVFARQRERTVSLLAIKLEEISSELKIPVHIVLYVAKALLDSERSGLEGPDLSILRAAAETLVNDVESEIQQEVRREEEQQPQAESSDRSGAGAGAGSSAQADASGAGAAAAPSTGLFYTGGEAVDEESDKQYRS